ncbi:hypothetical protein [Nonomuraea sp. 10N515B]|uniref:hypothetical protein n=1 Tax=Nonomuraea sp. 10N515B TaxID=3457422 RepID=UPI003FCE6E02
MIDDSDPGYLEARRDDVGPFIHIRWGQMRMAVREYAWFDFLDQIKRGLYAAEKVEGRRGWVRFEIDEALAEHERPVAWRPKVLEVPATVWDRFVDGVGQGRFASLRRFWTGVPVTEPPEARIAAVQGEATLGDASGDDPG